MNKKLIIPSVVSALLLPVMAFAVQTVPLPGVNPAINVATLIDLVFSFVWPVVGAVVVLLFIVAGFEFFNAGGDASKVAAARQHVIWGVAGVVVMLLAFSIPFIVKNTLGV